MYTCIYEENEIEHARNKNGVQYTFYLCLVLCSVYYCIRDIDELDLGQNPFVEGTGSKVMELNLVKNCISHP